MTIRIAVKSIGGNRVAVGTLDGETGRPIEGCFFGVEEGCFIGSHRAAAAERSKRCERWSDVSGVTHVTGDPMPIMFG